MANLIIDIHFKATYVYDKEKFYLTSVVLRKIMKKYLLRLNNDNGNNEFICVQYAKQNDSPYLDSCFVINADSTNFAIATRKLIFWIINLGFRNRYLRER